MSKVVFVGNVPYNMGEDQLIDVFKPVGQVVGFRLVFDRETGKPRGYGFCEFADHETAASAVRNLNNVDVGGRPLRIDLADSDPFLEGKTTVRGELMDSGESRSQWREREQDNFRSNKPSSDRNAFLASLPPSVLLPPGSNSMDFITNVLVNMDPNQLMEVLAQMKAFVITHPEQARILLVSHPQLAYALFQALIFNKIVDSSILTRMAAQNANSNPNGQQNQGPPPRAQPPYPSGPIHAPQPTGPPHQPPMNAGGPPPHMYNQHQPPPQMGMHQQPPPYFRPPPPAQPLHQQQAPPPQAQPEVDPAQKAMLLQVLSLTPDQVDALPPNERNAIMQLRNQFLGGITT